MIMEKVIVHIGIGLKTESISNIINLKVCILKVPSLPIYYILKFENNY